MTYLKVNLVSEAKRVIKNQRTQAAPSALLVILAEAYLKAQKRG
jgi:hypothetical protein